MNNNFEKIYNQERDFSLHNEDGAGFEVKVLTVGSIEDMFVTRI